MSHIAPIHISHSHLIYGRESHRLSISASCPISKPYFCDSQLRLSWRRIFWYSLCHEIDTSWSIFLNNFSLSTLCIVSKICIASLILLVWRCPIMCISQCSPASCMSWCFLDASCTLDSQMRVIHDCIACSVTASLWYLVTARSWVGHSWATSVSYLCLISDICIQK